MERHAELDGALRIGELATRGGVTVKAVRHYEAEGLLPPALRNDAGYRYFREEDLTVLRTITGLKRMGFSLREIREVVVLVRETCCPEVRPHLRDAADAKLREVELCMKELSQLQALLVRYRDAAAGGGPDAADKCSTAACACVEGAAERSSTRSPSARSDEHLSAGALGAQLHLGRRLDRQERGLAQPPGRRRAARVAPAADGPTRQPAADRAQESVARAVR